VDETTVAELIQLLQNESASIDMQFQLWIAITSAVLIASFVARLHLSFPLRIFVAVMYILASATIALRYANDAGQFVFLQSELSKKGVDYPAVIDLRPLRSLVYLLGTFATTAFIFIWTRPNADSEPANESLEQPDSEP